MNTNKINKDLELIQKGFWRLDLQDKTIVLVI